MQGVIEYEKEIQKTSSANVAPLSTEYTVNDEDESQDLSLTDVVSTSGFNFDTNESQILSHLDLKLTVSVRWKINLSKLIYVFLFLFIG